MAIPTQSALDTYVRSSMSEIAGIRNTLFQDSLKRVEAKIPIKVTPGDDPTTIPVKTWGSLKKMKVALKKRTKKTRKQKLEEAYDRAMSVL